jgi:hypothetical protein
MKTLGWLCVQSGLTWALLERDGSKIITAHAEVQRLPSGRWRWEVMAGKIFGVEPSRETAMSAADRVFSATEGGAK